VESITGVRERDIPAPEKVRVATAPVQIVPLDDAWGESEKAAG
jgi:hypothetical protein